MGKVYLKGGPFGGEVCEVADNVLFAQFPPDHVRYVDRGETNQAGQRIFVYEPRVKKGKVTDTVEVDEETSGTTSGEHTPQEVSLGVHHTVGVTPEITVPPSGA